MLLLVEPAIVPPLLEFLRPPLPPQIGKIRERPVGEGTCLSSAVLIEPTQAMLIPLLWLMLLLLLSLLTVVEDTTEGAATPGQRDAGEAAGASECVCKLLLLRWLPAIEGLGGRPWDLGCRP